MRKISRSYLMLSLAFITALFIISCKKDFDNPPGFVDPNITTNTTIRDLKALHSAGGFEQITDDKIIQGIVIADDKSGNYYLSIVIQDSTGGITLRLDGSDLYTSYPIGRRIYIKCKGLYLNDYNGLIQLGTLDNSDPTAPALGTIPSVLLDSFVIKGSLNNVVIPKVVTVSQLGTGIQDPYQSTLIELDNYEFAASDTGKTYADPANKATVSAVNYLINNCSGNSITLRTSSYADFAGITVPQGNGTVIAVYTVFRTTKQLNIRDTSDVHFTGTRCAGGGGTGPGNGTHISIASLRSMYTGSNIELGSNTISGVVISDASSKNISTGSVIIQDGNAGISVYFGGTISYNIGDSIVINTVAGDSLLNYKGSLELKTHYGATKPVPVATGLTVTPKVITIADLTSGLAASLGSASNIEFTLVKIAGATSPGGTFGGNKTITDASGSVTLYTASAATFAGTDLPAGTVDIVGYGSTFGSTKQLQVRNANDVTGGSTGGGGGGGTGNGTPISIGDLRALYSGTGVNLSAYKVGGIVISDASTKNLSTGDVILQSGNYGISVYFGGTITYNIGDSLVIDIAAGDSLISYNGSLEIKIHSGATKPAPVSSGNVVVPQVKTISELNTSLSAPLGSAQNIEYTLVKIVDATAPSGTYSGSKILTDATGTIALYTTSGATFSGDNLLTGTHSYTGYANSFNGTKELHIRSTSDVQ